MLLCVARIFMKQTLGIAFWTIIWLTRAALIYMYCTVILTKGVKLFWNSSLRCNKIFFTLLKLSQKEDLYLEKKSQKLCDTKVWKWLHKDLSLLCEIHEQQIHCDKIYMLRVLPCNITDFNYGHICKICYNLEYI